MKKSLITVMMSLLLVLVGCGAKKDTVKFTATPLQGAVNTITINSESDKITKVSAEIVMDNDKLQITDEDMAKQMAKGLSDSEDESKLNIKYSKKETVITYDVPEDLVKNGESLKTAEEQLEKMGYEKAK